MSLWRYVIKEVNNRALSCQHNFFYTSVTETKSNLVQVFLHHLEKYVDNCCVLLLSKKFLKQCSFGNYLYNHHDTCAKEIYNPKRQVLKHGFKNLTKENGYKLCILVLSG